MELLQSEAREKELREACKDVQNQLEQVYKLACENPIESTAKHIQFTSITNMSFIAKETLEKALASTGKEQLERDLEEAESVLEIITDFEFAEHPTYSSSTCFCFYCREVYNDFTHLNRQNTTGHIYTRNAKHTDTCELAARKKNWEAKRDSIKEALEGLK